MRDAVPEGRSTAMDQELIYYKHGNNIMHEMDNTEEHNELSPSVQYTQDCGNSRNHRGEVSHHTFTKVERWTHNIMCLLFRARYPGRQRSTEEPRPGDPGKWCAPEVGGLIECTCIHDAGCEDRGLRAGEARQ
ncbi:hypothetical protein NDU88_007964 [Pleurodeles waltl]|uniref:Uncharacterized protein n=1 Tax=Pleurodeles waltl TaxID=8319 RepID=A0AAV7N7E2_PLEWA|nr:hypothetical protein NDU88_007964 [Pleurodeles waltl]